STEPRAYLVSARLAASSTASEMAMPSEPWLLGSAARILRPASVRLLGLAITSPPQVCIIERRNGFWSKLTFTMYTRTSMPNIWPASDSDEPHWPAPVSVVKRVIPACLRSEEHTSELQSRENLVCR